MDNTVGSPQRQPNNLGLDARLSAAIVWQALEQAPDAMIVSDAAGIIRHANVTAETMFGHRRDDLIGQPLELLVPTHLREAHVGDRNQFLAEPVSRPMGAGLALMAQHRDGREIPVEISLTPVVGEAQEFVVAVIRDITERVGLIEAIAAQRDHLATIVDALGDGLMEVDLENRSVLLVNDRFCEMVGLEREAIIADGASGVWLVKPDLNELLTRLDSGSGRIDVTLRHRRGSTFPASLTIAAMRTTAQRPSFVAVFHDLTAELAAALTLSTAQARVAVADEHDRIARDLHDTVIQRLFATGLGLQGAAERSDVRDRIERAVTGIDEAIRDLRTSIFTLRQPVVNLGVSDSIRETAEEARQILDCALLVDISPDVDRHVPTALRGDLVAVVRESLTNVAKHASARTVALTVDIEDGHLTVHIKDDGVGFAASGVIFGQGLRNLKERAENLGGTCELSTAPGDGTRIFWSLPLPT